MNWDRNWGCRVELDGTLRGWQVAVLQNRKLRVSILLGKGCDVVEALYKPLDLDITPRTRRGLRSRDHARSDVTTSDGSFLNQYEGGWQEILPFGGPAGAVRGAGFPLHGESSRVPWSSSVLEDSEEVVEIECTTRLSIMPLQLTKRFRIEGESPVLRMATTVTNSTEVDLPLMWGHHLAFGFPLVGPGTSIEMANGTTYVASDQPHPGRRRTNGESGVWPHAMSRDGVELDLSVLPEEMHLSDLHYLEPPEAWFRIRPPQHEIAIAVTWDKVLHPLVWLWQEFGATSEYPWWGSEYLIGVEPWSGIADEIARQSPSITIAPGQSLTSLVSVAIEEGVSGE